MPPNFERDVSRANKAKECEGEFHYVADVDLARRKNVKPTSKNDNTITFDGDACQDSGSPCTGIYVNAVL